MASEWVHRRIEDITEKVGMGPFGSSIKVSTFVPDGIPVISGQHLHGSRLQDGEYNFIAPEHAEKLSNSNVFQGDVIFTHAGNIGQVAYIPDTSRYERYIISQRQFYLRCNRRKVLPPFITYYFKTREGQHKLLANSSPSGVPSIAQPVTYLRSIEVPTPPIPEQEAIVDILGSLDDKIELNRRMNATLEKMARAIFRAWFIDFEPVKAKVAGVTSFQSMPQDVFDQLPDQLTETELGPTPKGWDVVSLDNLFEINPRRPLKNGQIAPYLEMADMPTRGHAPNRWDERAFGSGMRFMNGDTLVARITPCLENGKTAFVDFLPPEAIGWGSTEYIVLRPLPPLPPIYAYCLARLPEFRDFAIKNMTGTSGRQRVAASSLTHFKAARPIKSTALAFGKIVGPMFAMVSANQTESRTLALIRDALLPKLISGEIRVTSAEGADNGK
ncbi:MAG: restriction endonuclease subunit S [Deltaproteobacteria bacterium]|nr:restriction endonuclease subunit S [Deltaproteobacteria bacterium]